MNPDDEQLELEKLHLEISRLIAESARLNRETSYWHPVLVAASIIG